MNTSFGINCSQFLHDVPNATRRFEVYGGLSKMQQKFHLHSRRRVDEFERTLEEDIFPSQMLKDWANALGAISSVFVLFSAASAVIALQAHRSRSQKQHRSIEEVEDADNFLQHKYAMIPISEPDSL
mmetsp:Transcript_152415/g.269142  ORF Transcript_152415/g.269142 Transcript_152415/m.269142 type:complete len:127 (+) Transcript_152415:27-407(+)